MAIQDSVKLGADVINMSLGSSCGFSDEDSVFSRGVQAASDAGTLLVISAGNYGLLTILAGRRRIFLEHTLLY